MAIVLALAGSAALAATSRARAVESLAGAAAPPAAVPRVKVGMFITQLYDFDLPRRSFNVAFWLWFLHTDADYKPVDSIEIGNAKVASIRYLNNKKKDDVLFNDVRSGVYWEKAKYTASITQDWDVARYPFDRQVLRIDLEDTHRDIKEVILEPDDLNASLFDEQLKVPGWRVRSMTLSVKDHLYNTDYGDPTLDGTSTHSRIEADIVVERDGWRLLVSMFIGFFVAFLLASASYLLEPAGAIASARIGLSGGAVFASVGNKYVIDNNIPPAPSFTLADGIEASTFAAILFAILVSVVVMTLRPANPVAAARINLACGLGSLLLYLGFNAGLIGYAAAA